MASEKTDFLRFNAYSMKELITRKMSEDSKFTDQIYEGSNLAILIDLVSYMYQVLVYQLNNAASESMFQDTQVYENINRLVNLLGYHPKGCKPAEIDAYMQEMDSSFYNTTLPPFSYIDTGLVDSNGESICFSVGANGERINNVQQHQTKLLNGKWKMYEQPFTSSGSENETFVLTGVKSDSADKKYVANDYIKAVVLTPLGNGEYSADMDWFLDRDELFVGVSRSATDEADLQKVYNNQERVYSVRLNQDKEYEITFGDGVVGKKLTQNDLVYVFYLETNGEGGDIDVGQIDQERKFRQIDIPDAVPAALREAVRGGGAVPPDDSYTMLYGSDTVEFKPEEGVEDIRRNAPDWFKTGNRLITRGDYEYWVKANQNGVVDVKCMNNWEYLATFYRWLYQNGLKQYGDGRHFIDNNLITRYNCKYIDAADANNVYLWVKTENESSTMAEATKSMCEQLKTITTEVEVLSPINVRFDLCAQSVEDMTDFSVSQPSVDADAISYLEVTMSDNLVYVNSSLQWMIRDIFTDYFSKTRCKLGQMVNLNDILNQIYAINGVVNVRTVCLGFD